MNPVVLTAIIGAVASVATAAVNSGDNDWPHFTPDEGRWTLCPFLHALLPPGSPVRVQLLPLLSTMPGSSPGFSFFITFYSGRKAPNSKENYWQDNEKVLELYHKGWIFWYISDFFKSRNARLPHNHTGWRECSLNHPLTERWLKLIYDYTSGYPYLTSRVHCWAENMAWRWIQPPRRKTACRLPWVLHREKGLAAEL